MRIAEKAEADKTTLPGYLYLMERPGEQQVGISNHPDRRLYIHDLEGWKLSWI